MQRYILFRIIQAVVALWMLSTVVFFILHVTGDPVAFLLPPDATAGQEEELRRSLGLDRPLYVQYVIFMKDAWTGDFGRSTTKGTLALDLLLERLPNTIQLALASIFFCIIIGIPLGVIAAIKRDSLWDNVAKFIALAGQSAPQFWLAILLIILLGAIPAERGLPSLPTFGKGGIEHLILPTVVLGWSIMAGVVRLTRSAMLEVLDSEYVKFARVKGLSERLVVWKHAAKNAVIPVLTFSGLALGGLLNGSVVVEVVFAWPGVGRLLLDGVIQRDFPVVEAAVLASGFFYVCLALIVDILYAYADPRIRY
ncbi:MAG: ABC transporter permease [SAR202 cluster bacterium]|nr:ABC transporter permease [SAR202 cluster bacterium]